MLTLREVSGAMGHAHTSTRSEKTLKAKGVSSGLRLKVSREVKRNSYCEILEARYELH